MASSEILIIGGGLSGFSAATKLMENGFEITILEAEDRIGGRVHSVAHSSGFIDLGAQWVHGQDDNSIHELVHEHFEFGHSEFPENDFDYYTSDGQKAPSDVCNKLDAVIKNIIASVSDSNSVGRIIESEYVKAIKLLPDYVSTDKTLVNQMLALNEKQANVGFASQSWFDVSTLHNSHYQKCEGNQMLSWKTDGFKKVFDFITKKLPDPSKHVDVDSKVQLDKEVTNINWSSRTGKILITCADGSSYTADHVIFTASLGVLKDRHQTLFTPNLPAEKISAIESIGFGAIGKIYLEFEHPFWPMESSKWHGYYFLWKDEDLRTVEGTDKEWLVDIMIIMKVDKYPNTLQTFVSPRGIEKFEASSDKQLIDDFMWCLENFLQKKLPRPTSMKRTRWHSNRNFLGTSSYISTDSQKIQVSPITLARPLVNSENKPMVLFAGEATHEKHAGCSHGAVSSGYRAADEILEFYANS